MRKTIEIVTREYLTEAEDGCIGYAETHRPIVLCEECEFYRPPTDTSLMKQKNVISIAKMRATKHFSKAGFLRIITIYLLLKEY